MGEGHGGLPWKLGVKVTWVRSSQERLSLRDICQKMIEQECRWELRRRGRVEGFRRCYDKRLEGSEGGAGYQTEGGLWWQMERKLEP